MEVTALLREAAAGRIPPLLLLHGPEALLVDDLLERVTRALLPDQETTDWNREVLHADQLTPDDLVGAGASLSLFGGRRLVLVRGVADLSAKTADRLRDALADARRAACGWPAEGTTVLLVAAGVDRRAAGLRVLPEADHVEVRPPAGRAVVGWLRERARGAGLDLLPEAAQTLVDLVGEDLGRLAAELEKAALYVSEDRRVSEDVVRALAGETRTRQYWELTQALEEARRKDALRIVSQLLASGDEPLILLAWLVGYLRDLWRVLPAAGDVREAAKALPRRRPDFAVERLAARARAVGIRGLSRAVERCFEVDQALKTGTGSPRAHLTCLVADLAG
ncbi:MAG: DNA polymerase III subunit delta [Candidatus Rokuibacteriota bacterium]